MSINKFQEKIFRTGCGSAVLYVSAAVFLGGMFYVGCGANQNRQGEDATKQKVVVQVGDTDVYAGDLSELIRRQTEQSAMALSGPLPPTEDARIQAKALSDLIQQIAVVSVAKKQGVQFTDQQITAELTDQMDKSVVQFKAANASQLKISAVATDKEFDAALAKAKRPTITELKSSQLKQFAAMLKDPKQRPQLEASVASTLLQKSLQAKIKPTDDELKASYDGYQFKKIQFGEDASGSVDAQIAKAQADLKSGMTFEQVIDRYSKATPPKGKKNSEDVETMDASALDQTPSEAPLKKLKPGEVSGVIEEFGQKTLYKMISMKNMAPPDLLTNKSKYVDIYTKARAEPQGLKLLEEATKPEALKWSSPGYKVLYEWMHAVMDFTNTKPIADRMQPIIAEAKTAAQGKNEGYDARPAMLAWYVAFDSIWTAPGADKTKLRADRIEVTRAICQDTPYFTLKIELVDLLKDQNSKEAGGALVDAASSNTFYDAQGLQNFHDVSDRLQKLKAANLITPEQEKQIVSAQESWTTENAKVEEEKAKAKAADEENKKAAAALDAQQKAEKAKADAANAAKDKAAGGKTSAPPATTGTTAGAPTTPATTAGAPKPTGTPAGGTATTGGTTPGKKQ